MSQNKRIDKDGETIIASPEVDLEDLDTDSLVEPSDLETERKERTDTGIGFVVKLIRLRLPGESHIHKEYEGFLEGLELVRNGSAPLDTTKVYQVWMSLEHAFEVFKIIEEGAWRVGEIIIKYQTGTIKMDQMTNVRLNRLKIERIERGTASCQLWFGKGR